MFSGGVDSTAAAVRLADQYDRIHLLTYDNGYGHSHMPRTKNRVAELNRLVADKYIHSLVSVRSIFERIVIDTLDRDFRHYGSGFIWCMGCKLAMHARTIAYDLTHGVTEACDGSNKDTSEMVEQMPVSLSMVSEIYREHGIKYFNPVYDAQRKDSDAMLVEKGFKMGLPLMGRRLAIQPSCRPGEIYYLPYVLFRQPPKHAEETVKHFIEDKSAIVREIITEMSRGPGR